MSVNKLILNTDYKIQKRSIFDILDGMDDWVRVVNENRINVYANKKMREGLNTTLFGKKCYEALGRDKPCEKCVTQIAIETGEAAQKEEHIGDRIFSAKASPIRDVNGNIYSAVEVFREVTRERKLEKEILKKNEKMSKDLKYSRAIQEKILPPKGKYGSMVIDYIYRPSELLSGDVFDIFNIDDRYTGIYICDVVGHGVTASMLTMFVRQTMRWIKNYEHKPGKALSELHKRFLGLSLEDDKYFTIFYGVLDNYNMTFTYSNGGHNSIPMLIKNNEIELLEAVGYPISYLFDNIEYNEKTVKFRKGDKILLYTDGILEAKNKDGELFGFERLLKIVENKEENLIHLIEKNIDKFKYSTQEDDFAILKARIE